MRPTWIFPGLPVSFRTVTGTTPDGRKALVIWRKRRHEATDPVDHSQLLEVGSGHAHRLGGDPLLLGPGHEVVHEDSEPAPRPGGEVGDRAGKIVHAVQGLDDDPLQPEVLAPDLLHQLGVVDRGQRHEPDMAHAIQHRTREADAGGRPQQRDRPFLQRQRGKHAACKVKGGQAEALP